MAALLGVSHSLYVTEPPREMPDWPPIKPTGPSKYDFERIANAKAKRDRKRSTTRAKGFKR